MSIQITRECCVCRIHNPNEIFVNWITPEDDPTLSVAEFKDRMHEFYNEWMCEDCSDLWKEFEDDLLTIKN